MISLTWAFRRWNPFRLDKLFRRLQLVSAGLYSLGHGGNDAQKTMGSSPACSVASGRLSSFEVPLWVILLSTRRSRSHDVRRLADREDDGQQDHEAAALPAASARRRPGP